MILTGTIVSIHGVGEHRAAKVNLNGAMISVPLSFLSEAVVGDQLLIEGGVAIAIIAQQSTNAHHVQLHQRRKEENHVPRNSR
jgi:hydrogenase maturation factor